jgi:hypothetical protein
LHITRNRLTIASPPQRAGAIRSKIFLAKPLRRKANFKHLNVPNWMQMTYSEPPKIEGITPAQRTAKTGVFERVSAAGQGGAKKDGL